MNGTCTSYVHLPSISSNYENEKVEHSTKYKKKKSYIYVKKK